MGSWKFIMVYVLEISIIKSYKKWITSKGSRKFQREWHSLKLSPVLSNSFIQLIQQIFIIFIQCVGHCSSSWGYISGEDS